MNRSLRVLVLMVSAVCAATAQTLEIHTINVGWGNSAFVKGPNGTTILIEAGNTGKGTNEVVPYLQSIGLAPSAGFDYTIAGHQHCDHIGGLDEVINAGYDVRIRNYYNGSSYSSTCVTQWNTTAAATTAGALVVMTVGTTIDLGNGALLTCIASNGSILGGGNVAVSDENDRSLAVLIKYGEFDYLWSSDLGGGSDDGSCTGRSTNQVNVETSVINAISPGGARPLISDGGIDVLAVNHHGSESSTNKDWFNKSRPALAIVSTGAGQSSGWDLPRIDVVEHVLLAQATACITAPPTLVLQTEEGAPTGSLTSFAGYCSGDIVVTTTGTGTFNVSADGAVTQGPDERTAAGLPLSLALDDAGGGGDITPPVISNIQATNISTTGATITWTTDEPATSVVDYGLTSAYGSSQSNATLVTNHSVSLSGLSASTLYHYRVTSADAALNSASSSDQSFTTTTGGGGGTAHLVISEVLYDTPGTDAVEEWVEIYNQTTSTIDASGWTLTDNNGTGTSYAFPAGTTILPGTYLTVAADAAGFQALYGRNADVYGAIPALNNDGETLLLKNGTVIVDAVAWEGGATAGLPAGWGSTTLPTAPTGSTVVRTDATTDSDSYADWGTAANNGNPQTQTLVSEYAPASMTISTGIAGSGNYTNLATDNASYATINSTTSGTRTTDWYATVTIAEAPASVTGLTIVYNGKQSRSGVLQKTYLFNYSSGAWNQVDSRNVSTTDVTVTYSPAVPTEYVSVTGLIRVRVLSTYNNRNFTTSADYVHYTVVTSAGGAASTNDEGFAPLLKSEVPVGYELGQNYPNPFNPTTIIPFRLRQTEHVTLRVFDMLGHEVMELVNDVVAAGSHSITFNAAQLSSGTYVYHLATPTFNASRRLTLIK